MDLLRFQRGRRAIRGFLLGITEPATPDTIDLIHGFWVTPRSWEHWIQRYEARAIVDLTVPQVFEHLENSGGINNDDRAPLLFISGSENHLMPPKVQQSNAKHHKSNTITEVKEFEGRAHVMPALSWAVNHAKQPSPA